MPIPRIIEEKMAALAEAHRRAENARTHVNALVDAWGLVPTDAQFAEVEKATHAETCLNTILRVQVKALLKAYGEQLELEEKGCTSLGAGGAGCDEKLDCAAHGCSQQGGCNCYDEDGAVRPVTRATPEANEAAAQMDQTLRSLA